MEVCFVKERLGRLAAPFCLLFFAPGCSSPPSPTATDDIAAATGIADAVAFVEQPISPVASPADAALPLGTAIRGALSQDPRIQGALAQVQQAFADAEQARLLPNPILSILIKLPDGGQTCR